MRLVQSRRLVNRLRIRTDFHWSTVVISALVINTFLIAYAYFNLGVPEKAFAGTMTAVANGNWTSSSTWSGGRVPQNNDTLIIPFGATVTVDVVTASYSHLLIIVNGTLYFNGGKKIIMCDGMVIVNAGGYSALQIQAVSLKYAVLSCGMEMIPVQARFLLVVSTHRFQ
jgi:hypothetical protein